MTFMNHALHSSAAVCADTDPGFGLRPLPAAWRARPSTPAAQTPIREEPPVNKSQLIQVVTDATGDRTQATLAVETTLDAIVRTVVAGDVFSVTGFGSLTPDDRPARDARNPQTGEPMRVDASRVVRFRPGARFKDLLAGRRAMPESGNCIQKDPKTPQAARP